LTRFGGPPWGVRYRNLLRYLPDSYVTYVAESPSDKSRAGVASVKRLDDSATHCWRNPGFPFIAFPAASSMRSSLAIFQSDTYIADLFGDRTGVGVPSKRINDLGSGVDIHDEVSFWRSLTSASIEQPTSYRAGVTDPESTSPLHDRCADVSKIWLWEPGNLLDPGAQRRLRLLPSRHQANGHLQLRMLTAP
jgi:hypothetical protein